MNEIEKNPEETIPFYPDHARTEIRVIGGLLVIALIIGALGILFPIGLDDPADPMNTPEHVKPEWYFLGLYQLLKYIPKTAGVLFPFIAIGLLIIWPFMDHKPDTKRQMWFRVLGAIVLMAIIIAATIWGGVS